jgi:4-hydroxybenzoate polyprenyltransferase
METIRHKLREFSELLKLEHSLFALPFAFVAVFLAAEGLPDLKTTFLVIACMVCARTAGMSFNRVLDAKFDIDNPRTADRAVAAGRVSKSSVTILGVLCLAGLSFFAWLLNDLAFYLSPLCHLLLVGYSLAKRFTWSCHIILGLVEAFAPIGGWIAVTGDLNHPTPWLLGLSTILWFTGMDIVYATQDADFDKERGLHSIPARFGLKGSLIIARSCHILTMALLAWAGWAHGAGVVYGLGWCVVGTLFFAQHRLVRIDDQARLDFAFFNLNVWVSLALMVSALADVLFRAHL